MKKNINQNVARKVFSRDNCRCRACGFTDNSMDFLEADHIVPECQGGKATLSNLQTLCTVCNKIKGASDIGELPILPPAGHYGDFEDIQSRKDNFRKIVASARQTEDQDHLELAKKWKSEGVRRLTIRKRLDKITTSGKVEKILEAI